MPFNLFEVVVPFDVDNDVVEDVDDADEEDDNDSEGNDGVCNEFDNDIPANFRPSEVGVLNTEQLGVDFCDNSVADI